MAASEANKDSTRELPQGFTPAPTQVIIGRGKKVTNHGGNRRLADIVKSELPNYQNALSKTEKSCLLVKIVTMFRKANSDSIGFVKQHPKTGKWLRLNESQSRVAVSQAFRDLLSTSYRSSRGSKQAKRLMEKNGLSGVPADPQGVSLMSAYQVALQADQSAFAPPAQGGLSSQTQQFLIDRAEAPAASTTYQQQQQIVPPSNPEQQSHFLSLLLQQKQRCSSRMQQQSLQLQTLMTEDLPLDDPYEPTPIHEDISTSSQAELLFPSMSHDHHVQGWQHHGGAPLNYEPEWNSPETSPTTMDMLAPSIADVLMASLAGADMDFPLFGGNDLLDDFETTDFQIEQV